MQGVTDEKGEAILKSSAQNSTKIPVEIMRKLFAELNKDSATKKKYGTSSPLFTTLMAVKAKEDVLDGLAVAAEPLPGVWASLDGDYPQVLPLSLGDRANLSQNEKLSKHINVNNGGPSSLYPPSTYGAVIPASYTGERLKVGDHLNGMKSPGFLDSRIERSPPGGGEELQRFAAAKDLLKGGRH